MSEAGYEREGEPPSAAELLQERFPGWRPLQRPPSLLTFNGLGVMLYGARDRDRELGLYVKTTFLVVVFVPILALRSYVVADAGPGRWSFLGTVPLSPLARTWNKLVALAACALIAAIAWTQHVRSPEYVAAQRLAAAQAAEARGELLAALEAYVHVARGRRASEARGAVRRLLAEPILALPLAERTRAVRLLTGGFPRARQLFDAGTLDAYLGSAVAACAREPRAALELITALRPVAPEGAVAAAHEQALAACLAASPADAALATELALIYEARGELERCVDVLLPARAGLGEREGARILGSALAARGEMDEAHALLLPYVEGRLEALRHAERALQAAQQRAWDEGIAFLEAGRASQRWYRRYDAADDAGKQAAVEEFQRARLAKDTGVAAARRKLEEAAEVVPVALDLGIVKLMRARAVEDPDARRAELEAAEGVFLAIGGVAGKSAAYQLNLARVRYWLGREEEGRALLDELLVEAERSDEALEQVSRVLREVGATTEGVALAEEAYEKAADPARKQAIASYRAAMALDLEDKILWLERSDAAQPEVRAELNAARGTEALRAAEYELAARHLRAAIGAYEELPEDAVTLNNRALIQRTLSAATGDLRAFSAYVELVERAGRLDPRNTILTENLARALIERAAGALIAERIDLSRLRETPTLELLDHLHDGEDARVELVSRLFAQPDIAAAQTHLRNLRVIAPKAVEPYVLAWQLAHQRRDARALRSLEEALDGVALDLVSQYAALDGALEAPTAEQLAGARARRAQLASRVEALRREDAPLTLAVALCALSDAEAAGFTTGESLDPDLVVSLADEALRVSPSYATRSAARAAYLLRAVVRLSAALPAFAAVRERTHRLLRPSVLICAALLAPDAGLRAAVAEDPDVAHAAALTAEDARRHPRVRSVATWALLQATSPEQAATYGEALRADECAFLLDRVLARLCPALPEVVLRLLWHLRLRDEPEAAASLAAEAKRHGVPLPWVE